MTKIPTIYDFPPDVMGAFDYAAQTTPREWVSNYQIGHWDALFDYDLTSAYLAAASQLPDLRTCAIYRSEMLDALYGFVKGDLYIDPSHSSAFCSPIIVDRGDGTLANAVGHLPTDIYPLDQIRFILNHNMGTFNAHDGWFITSTDDSRPFAALAVRLLEMRELESRQCPGLLFSKRIATGIIGKLLESYRDSSGNVTKYGDLYNPIYHALITSATKVRVAEFIVHHRLTSDELVHVSVDGIKTTRRIRLPDTSAMGEWRSNGSLPTLVFSPGRVYTTQRPRNGMIYHLLTAQMSVHPRQSTYSAGSVTVDLSTLYLDQDRAFGKLPRTGSVLLSSAFKSSPVIL